MTNEELKEEMRQDMLQEAREEEFYENKMHDDEDYAIEQFFPEIEEAFQLLKSVQDKLEAYGHIVKRSELLEMVW
jgi:hypothetical protein